jgi:murein DD-endopeptidase MepM/ murein hydrolase activator NlpD
LKNTRDHLGYSMQILYNRIEMNKAILFFLMSLCLSITGLSQSQEESQEALSQISTRLDFRALNPGEIVKVSITGNSDIKRAQISFNGKTYPMARGSAQGEYFALVGLDLGIKPGTYALKYTVVFTDGHYEQKNERVSVAAKDYPVKRLWVDEKFVTPPKEVMRRIEEESQILRSLYAIFTPEWLADGAFIIPSEGEVVPNFGERRFFNDKPRSSHSGVDISSPFGAPVKASNAGKVVLASDLYFAGKTVIIDHGLGVFSIYCHFSRFRVQRSDCVQKGEVIGEIGSTGRVTGPHLHWGIKIQGSRVDPFSLLSLSFSP